MARALIIVTAVLCIGAAPAEHVVRLAIPGASNEYVTLAAVGDMVAATWAATSAAGETAIYAAVSGDAGRTFGNPVRLTPQADVGGEQPPRIVVTPATAPRGSEIVVVWTAKSVEGTRLFTSRSRDRGRTFSAPQLVAGTAAPGNRGWESMTVDAMGRPVVTWLDHRQAVASTESSHHHHDMSAAATSPVGRGLSASPGGPDTARPTSDTAAAEQSVARAATSRLYVGSTDGGIPVQGLTHGVCYCCKTAIAAASNGDLMLAWRHVYAGGYRDIAFSMSRDGGKTFSTPVRISSDGWQIAGCPEDGPALAVDSDRRTHVVWPTLVRENGREVMALFHAVTTNGDVFSGRTRLPAGDSAFHPQVVVTSTGQLVTAWDEGSSGTRRIRLAHGQIDQTGSVRFEALDDVSAPGDHPALAAVPDGVVVAWASGSGQTSGIQVIRRGW